MRYKTATTLAAIAAAICLVLFQPLAAFAQDDAARAEAIAQADKQMKQLLHAVQLAVERYSLDHGACPPDIQALMDEGYLSSPPANPYSGLDEAAPEKVVQQELGDRPLSGAVVYHPFSTDGKALDGYILLAAGMRESDHRDLFYGEPRWDSLFFFTADGRGDGRPERYIILLTSPILTPDMVVAVTHDAAWLNAQPEYRAKKALHSMQLAVERYGVDHDGDYPPDLQTVVDEGYTYWPLNPYYGIVPGATLRVDACAPGAFKSGGIVYQPATVPERFGDCLAAYTLGVYGDDPSGGMDVGSVVDGEWRFYDPFGDETTLKDGVPDGIILVLASGPAP